MGLDAQEMGNGNLKMKDMRAFRILKNTGMSARESIKCKNYIVLFIISVIVFFHWWVLP